MTGLYGNAAILAGMVVCYSAVSLPVARSWLSGPILFTAAGLALGPLGLGALDLQITGADLRTLAELALAMVLFSDAAHADLSVVRRSVGLPERLLLIGLPLTIVAGFLVGVALFPGLDLLEVALLAGMLAPTDAALGAPVVSNAGVPAATREALNLESGLNDGICVPVILVLLDIASGVELHHGTVTHALLVVAEEIGIGLAAGVVLAGLGAVVLRLARRRGGIDHHWLHVPVVALAALCFCAAQALGGSGFIACFAGGLLFGFLRERDAEDMLGGAASTGEVLAMLTWLTFGGPVLGRLLPEMGWRQVAYAVLSLSVVRIAPVLLSLAGTGLGMGQKLFIGWFGPRGLASIVFAVIVVDAGLPGARTVAVTAACTVLMSVVAHGMTANPLVMRLRAA
ncbi:MAG: cation:proton antiporter [Proteobacteria bacterium]|nr:cation:proton antiporter [Pseudomonadota bacterium]